jgi:hypothetical protein
MQPILTLFLAVVIPPRLVYPAVLDAVDTALDDVERLVTSDAFKESEIYDEWVKFCNLAEERIDILNAYDNGETSSMRACDNLKVI